jgi:hypothetical protein
MTEDMYGYIEGHQLIEKYFSGYSTLNKNIIWEGHVSTTRFKSFNNDEYICEDDDVNGMYSLLTHYCSKNKL